MMTAQTFKDPPGMTSAGPVGIRETLVEGRIVGKVASISKTGAGLGDGRTLHTITIESADHLSGSPLEACIISENEHLGIETGDVIEVTGELAATDTSGTYRISVSTEYEEDWRLLEKADGNRH